MAQRAFDVFLAGRKIDTVSYRSDADVDEVRVSLIAHDGFPAGIVVHEKGKRGRKSNSHRRNPETEVTELVLYITNDSDLYRRQAQPIIANLAKKKRKGVYDATKALKLWGYLADAGAQKYTREFDSGQRTSFGAFSKADRVAAAKELADSYAEELADAAGTRSNPRHRRIKMARRKKSRRRSGTNRGSVRVVRFRTRGGRVKIVRFHKAGTKAAKRGSARKKAQGHKLARKYKLVWKGKSGSKRVFLRMPGGRLKKIRQPHR